MDDDDPSRSRQPSGDVAPRFEYILRTAAAYNPEDDLDAIRRAFTLAERVHRHQRRMSAGERYIVHPLSVARLCAEHRMDVVSVAAAILHDCIEDSDESLGVTQASLAAEFGIEVAVIVDGLTKLQRHEVRADHDPKLATLVKLLQSAAAADIRIIVIKVFDRADNIRSLQVFPPQKQRRIAAETREFYIPIATRLGFYKQARVMEDHVMRVLLPEPYEAIGTWLRTAGRRLETELTQVGREICEQLSGHGVAAQFQVYPKGIFSIFESAGMAVPSRERLDDGCNFNLRLVVEDEDACFRALAVVHRRLAHQRETVRDFIHSPKINGYQSLHTICRGPTLPRVQVLIRTRQMDEEAHLGVVAQIRSGRLQDSRWLTELLDSLEEETAEVLGLTRQLAYPEIEVFTPKGRSVRLPEGASALDFAYAIHTDLGETATRALIDGDDRPLRTVLRPNQRVEILLGEDAGPTYQHLEWVRTNRARIAIRRAIRRGEQAAFAAEVQALCRYSTERLGWELHPASPAMASLLEALGLENEAELGREIFAGRLWYEYIFAAAAPWMPCPALQAMAVLLAGSGPSGVPAPPASADEELVRHWARERLHEQLAQEAGSEQPVSLPGLRHPLPQTLAACCRPEYGDEIVAVTVPQRGATLHRWSCREIRTLVQEKAPRITRAAWSKPPRRRLTELLVRGRDRRGLLAAIGETLLHQRLDIQFIQFAACPDGTAEGRIRLDLQETVRPEQVAARLRGVAGVTQVRLERSPDEPDGKEGGPAPGS